MSAGYSKSTNPRGENESAHSVYRVRRKLRPSDEVLPKMFGWRTAYDAICGSANAGNEKAQGQDHARSSGNRKMHLDGLRLDAGASLSGGRKHADFGEL